MTSHNITLSLQFLGQFFLVVIFESRIWDDHKRNAQS